MPVTKKDVKQIVGGLVLFAAFYFFMSWLFTANPPIAWIVFGALFIISVEIYFAPIRALIYWIRTWGK